MTNNQMQQIFEVPKQKTKTIIHSWLTSLPHLFQWIDWFLNFKTIGSCSLACIEHLHVNNTMLSYTLPFSNNLPFCFNCIHQTVSKTQVPQCVNTIHSLSFILIFWGCFRIHTGLFRMHLLPKKVWKLMLFKDPTIWIEILLSWLN